MKLLPLSFYRQTDTISVAQALLGKLLVTVDLQTGIRTSGRITETEAYCGTQDKACHAFGGRRSARTETMYAAGGKAYIYRCYGIHHLLNVVTHRGGEPHAVLLRAIEPLEGIDVMLTRRGIAAPASGRALPVRLCTGPGSLSVALGLHTDYNGSSLQGPRIALYDDGHAIDEIASGPRVGISGAGPEAAVLPWRFWPAGSRWVSRYVP